MVDPFGETVQQVFARISAVRDALDGPQLDDQGLFNTDPRAQAVPEGYVNFVPTDIQGITFGRTPQQVPSLSPLLPLSPQLPLYSSCPLISGTV